MAENEVYDLVIVGGGPGGLSAGIYAMRAALKTVLIEKGLPGGQINLTESVENYPGFENISGFDLSQKLLQHAKSYGLEVRQEEVAVVEPGLEFHSVRLADGQLVNTHTVILATGGSPRKLNIPGELEYYGKGVSYCATCDGFFFHDKTVVVVGGGDTALEEALYLAKITRQVYLAHRRDAGAVGFCSNGSWPKGRSTSYGTPWSARSRLMTRGCTAWLSRTPRPGHPGNWLRTGCTVHRLCPQ